MRIAWRNPNSINPTSFSIVKTLSREQATQVQVLYHSSRGPGALGTLFELLANRHAVSRAA